MLLTTVDILTKSVGVQTPAGDTVKRISKTSKERYLKTFTWILKYVQY